MDMCIYWWNYLLNVKMCKNPAKTTWYSVNTADRFERSEVWA